MKNSLVNTLLHLSSLDGPSRSERPVADFITGRMEVLGYRVEEDRAGDTVDGDTGNLLCFPPRFNPEQPAFMMVAHMDTVRSTSSAHPVIKDGKITGDNNRAIGVDNRVGCAVLLHGAEYMLHNRSAGANIIYIFTICEEIGSRGAKALSVPPNVVMGTVFDCSARPGAFIQSTFGAEQFTLEIHGKGAHAGVEPEKGINAINMMARVIASLQTGRISPDLTCNIANISGGGPLNVVPEYVKVNGEIRGTKSEQIKMVLNQIEKSADEVCKTSHGTFSLTSQTHFSPYRIAEDSRIFKLVSKSLQSLHFTPNPIHYSGGSDANIFNANGLPTINLGIGAQRPHANDEFVYMDDLVSAYQIATKLIDEFSAGN